MIGDLLLTWISENGSGTIDNFQSHAEWLARTENIGIRKSATHRWLRNMSSLGHCEVDWKRGSWSVAPPVITRLPMADGLAIMIGARRPRLLRTIEVEEIYAEYARRPGFDGDIPAPSTIVIPYEHTTDLAQVATALDATYTDTAASGIAALLRPPAALNRSAPPAYDSPLELLVSVRDHTWTRVRAEHRNPRDGLYREHVHGRWRHILRRNGYWYTTEFSHGVYLELSRQGIDAIRWQPDGERRPHTGTAIVDRYAPLPALHSRAFALCSGSVPRQDTTTNTYLYDNVPRLIAIQIATSLNQTLHGIS